MNLRVVGLSHQWFAALWSWKNPDGDRRALPRRTNLFSEGQYMYIKPPFRFNLNSFFSPRDEITGT